MNDLDLIIGLIQAARDYWVRMIYGEWEEYKKTTDEFIELEEKLRKIKEKQNES